MSPARASGRSAGQTITIVALVAVAVVLIVAAVIFFSVPAHSLPSFMGKITHPVSRGDKTRPLHGVAVLVLALGCLVWAYFVNRERKPGTDTAEPDNTWEG